MADILERSYCTGSAGKAHLTMEYWKAEAERWKLSYETIRVELDDFTVGSGDLERELDQELGQCKQKISRLQADTAALTEANRSLKADCAKSDKRNGLLEEQIQQCNAQRQTLLQQRRELEQTNDSMETAHRILTASVSDLSKRIEELMETKALLENELEQTRRQQKEREQRLRDEMKDLADELAALKTTRRPDDNIAGSRTPLDPSSTAAATASHRFIDLDLSSTTIRMPALASGYYNLDFSSNELIHPKLRDLSSCGGSSAKKSGDFGGCGDLKSQLVQSNLNQRVSVSLS